MANRSPARISGSGRLLSWLVDPGYPIRDDARPILLGELLSAPVAIVMGALNGLVVTAAALWRTGAPDYLLFGLLELLLLGLRARHIVRVRRARARAQVPVIDRSVLLSIAWCSLQGALAFSVMARGEPELMILSATMTMALIGPICARNYAAPRLAMLLVCLCDLPFAAGAVASRIPLLLVIVPMTPMFLLGVWQIIRTFHHVLVETLEAEARYHSLARHDALTGLLNRFGLDDMLAALPRAPDHAMAVLCIDLDGFKQVNDRFGHAGGDHLLEQVATRLRTVLRADDLVARLGGDEFMVVVHGMQPAEVETIARRLIDRIAREPYLLSDDRSARVGASIGYACFPEDATTTAVLRTYADQALYAAKAGGKGVGRRFTRARALSATA